jgi:hypothetical protein
MREARVLKAINCDGRVFEIQVEISGSRDWNLRHYGVDGALHSHDASDVFAAMQMMREELEAQGIKLLCAGARTDVWPSAMSRDMGGGRKAYIQRLGEKASQTDLVDIFDFAETALIGTVEQQREYHKAWLRSLGWVL